MKRVEKEGKKRRKNVERGKEIKEAEVEEKCEEDGIVRKQLIVK